MTDLFAEVTTKACSTVAPALRALDESARHINVYRALSYHVSAIERPEANWAYDLRAGNRTVGDFDCLDQDKQRPLWARRLQLTKCGPILYSDYRNGLQMAVTKDVRNLSMLHALQETRKLVLGEKSPAESLKYIRRSARKLHPDLTADLAGWTAPGWQPLKTWNGVPVEHAKRGANNLFNLHCSFKQIIRNPYYQRHLWSSVVAKGSRLTVGDLAQDWTMGTMAGLVIGLLRKKWAHSIAIGSGVGYLALVAIYLIKTLINRRSKKPAEVLCRDLVLYTGNISRS